MYENKNKVCSIQKNRIKIYQIKSSEYDQESESSITYACVGIFMESIFSKDRLPTLSCGGFNVDKHASIAVCAIYGINSE